MHNNIIMPQTFAGVKPSRKRSVIRCISCFSSESAYWAYV